MKNPFRPRWPKTDAEYRVLADEAARLLKQHLAEKHDLITNGVVNVGRCELLLAEAKARGITPKLLE